jgi:methionine aminotransferase
MLLDYSQISSENEMDFAVRLTKECKVATVPVSPFYSNEVDNKTLRICFAKTDETLLEAANILKRI